MRFSSECGWHKEPPLLAHLFATKLALFVCKYFQKKYSYQNGANDDELVNRVIIRRDGT